MGVNVDVNIHVSCYTKRALFLSLSPIDEKQQVEAVSSASHLKA